MLEKNKPFKTWAIVLGLAAVAYIVWSALYPAMSLRLACTPPAVLMIAGAVLLGVQEARDKLAEIMQENPMEWVEKRGTIEEVDGEVIDAEQIEQPRKLLKG